MELVSKPEPLTAAHQTASFACGKAELDDWIQHHALDAQYAHTARVFVVHEALRVVGYHATAAASVERKELPSAQRWGVPAHAVPCVLIARLAVATDWQHKGIGPALLKDALRRAVSAAESIGVRAVLVHAKDIDAKRFYEYFDFKPSPTDPLHLFLPIRDVIAAMV